MSDRETLSDSQARAVTPHGEFRDLSSEESELRGGWLDLGSHLVRDGVCARIEWLVSDRLQLRGTADDGRATLYRDPLDGRLWELTRSAGTEGIVNAPLKLAVIAHTEASARYGPSAG